MLVYTHDSRNVFQERRREPTSNDLGNRLDDTDAHDDESEYDTCISWYLLPSRNTAEFDVAEWRKDIS